MVEEERVVIDEKILGGKPVIRGTRIPVYLIVELVA
ncbi:MAG: antitoxin, partial [Thaumarchaeota archaeon]